MTGSTAGLARRWTAGALTVLVSLGTAAATVPSASGQAAEETSPTITHLRTIRTTPFTGSSVSMRDHEGSAYVARDNSLWLSDDEGQRLYEVNARTGVLKRMVTAKRLAATKRFRGTTLAGRARTRDLESISYDAKNDRLYVFSGSDCKPSTSSCRWKSLPTVFRLTRIDGRLRPQSFQPLPARTQTTGSAWHPGSGRLYVGDGPVLRPYHYRRNALGAGVELPGPLDVFGLTFTKNGRGLFAVHGDARLSRMTWPARSLLWTADLSAFGVRDARSVARVGRRLLVSDGYDHRPAGSRLSYAVFVVRIG